LENEAEEITLSIPTPEEWYERQMDLEVEHAISETPSSCSKVDDDIECEEGHLHMECE
jgi:hypothetical protein